jgi:hypothetical protein
MSPPPAARAVASVLGSLVLATAANAAAQITAQPTVQLHYTFQPDCYRAAADSSRCASPSGDRRLDLGPQIAVWVEKDGAGYLTELLVTNLTAVRGIGNRPGYWKFPSSWRFPYGKRVMALPVWAHRRGKLYPTVVLQDDGGSSGGEMGIGFHEQVSSPDGYHCLTFMPSTWVYNNATVDAITCPTGVFNSSKGRLAEEKDDAGNFKIPQTYYPPRNDITTSRNSDCDRVWSGGGECPLAERSVLRYEAMNDLDAVAAATPPYGQPFTGTWNVPSDLPDGDYSVVVEINKEFDNNAAHAHMSYVDPRLPDAGFTNNFGQPSVVFRVPIHIDRTRPHQAAVSTIDGYGDWDGATGMLHPVDSTISDKPGSGAGRLLPIMEPAIDGGAAIEGRVHVVTEVRMPVPCDPALAGTGKIERLEVSETMATEAAVRFVEPGEGGRPVERYEIRYRLGNTMDEEQFKQAVPAANLKPSVPGGTRTFQLGGLKPNAAYVVGIRARGGCIGDGPLAFVSFVTPAMEFKQLSGCFIATAAYGTALAPELSRLRKARDAVRERSAFGAALVDGYERSSPPVAAVLRESDLGRAVVRTLLAPFVGVLGDAPAPSP